MASISYYRNETTDELAPPHLIGTDEEGRELYLFIDGWYPTDASGNEIECEQDCDGNWIQPEE